MARRLIGVKKMNDDLISRQEAIDALESEIDYFDDYDENRGLVKAQQVIRELPPASKSYILQKLEKQRREREGE